VKVLLVNPNYGIRTIPSTVSLGLLSIASFLKERGFHVRLYDRNVEQISLEIILQDFKPDIAGVSVISMLHIEDGALVSRQLRKHGIPIVWGGHMASVVPELVLREGCADYVVVGEGEITFYELLQAIETKREIKQINGIVYLDKFGSVHHTAERAFANLANFPVIDWSFVDPEKYFVRHVFCERMMHLYCSKGCPERCAFCFNKGFHHCKHRRRPIEDVICEMKSLAMNHNMDGVYFMDESFGLHKGELRELCGHLREMKLVWGCQTRLGHLTREDYQLMYDSGLRWVFFGVESGSQEMLERIHKRIDITKVETEFRLCREIGISATGGFIVGYPNETEEQLRETVRLMLRLDQIALIRIATFVPIPGAELYTDLVESGQLTPCQTLQEWSDYGSVAIQGVVANFSNVPTLDLNVIQSVFLWRRFFSKNFAKSATTEYKVLFSSIISSLSAEWKRGFLYLCKDVFASFNVFFKMAWYNFAFPGVRKKYGLHKKRGIK